MKTLIILLSLISSNAFAKVYAVVEGGKVTNMVEWNGSDAWEPSKDQSKTLVDVTSKNKDLGNDGKPGTAEAIFMGDNYVGDGKFEKP